MKELFKAPLKAYKGLLLFYLDFTSWLEQLSQQTTDPSLVILIPEIFLLRKFTWDSILIEFVITAGIWEAGWGGGETLKGLILQLLSGCFINLVSHFNNFLRDVVYGVRCVSSLPSEQTCLRDPAFYLLRNSVKTWHEFDFPRELCCPGNRLKELWKRWRLHPLLSQRQILPPHN